MLLNHFFCKRRKCEDKTNILFKVSSSNSSENIQKKEGGPDRPVSDNQSCSVTLNELAMKSEKKTCKSMSKAWFENE